jgi:anti-sigma regulatory factor (Ser/Thr protein kinase)
VDDLVLAVGELTANTRAHTTGPGTLAIWTAPGQLTCQVTDSGHITDPLAGHVDPGPDAVSHRGLWIVNQVCDFVQLRTSPAGTTIRLHTRLGR